MSIVLLDAGRDAVSIAVIGPLALELRGTGLVEATLLYPKLDQPRVGEEGDVIEVGLREGTR